ncbi:hypothetical protein V1512DRAFT_276956 [Lipomyces arxii]|uniref:uncharacterized protein n=1 Tax=Lipomyces arxii TaxID=56418 RepID=UPI0034CEB6D1
MPQTYQGSGKSAPLLIQQILHYLPGSASIAHQIPQFPTSALGSSVPIVPYRSIHELRNRDKSQRSLNVPISPHVHRLISDNLKTVNVDTQAINADKQIVTAREEIKLICSVCRCHFVIKVQEGHEGDCGKSPMEIHHFVVTAYSQVPADANELDDSIVTETCMLTCNICSTSVSINVHKALLTDEIVATFKQEAIDARFAHFEILRNEKLAAEGLTAPGPLIPSSPLSNFNTLMRILHDPLVHICGERSRSIRIDNNAVNTKIDPSILPTFFFTKDEQVGVWLPPMVNEDTPESKQMRKVLEDASMEIAILAWQETNNKENPYQISIDSDLQTVKRALKCADYPTIPRKITYIEPTSPIFLRCASLGAVPDFSDALLLQTFDRQNACDPSNAQYYLECLREISTTRQSEELQIRVVELQSMGALTRDDLKNAYKEIGIDDPEAVNDDSLILGIFKARLQDSPGRALSMKAALKIVAETRDSEVLRAYIQADSMDEQTSYRTLGLVKETDDDTVKAAYETYLQDSITRADLYNSALMVIARSRQSPSLLSYVEKRGLAGPLPDVKKAYRMLGIMDTMDDSQVLAVFNIRVNDMPDDVLKMRGALRSIMDSRRSAQIKHFLESGVIDTNIGPEGTDTNPVGLWNIGNTCYLNSLLQYYFTIKPLREMILSFDLSANNVAGTIDRRIGGRKVKEWEIARGQEFIRELGELFQNLITTKESSVEPKYQLAYLALINSREAFEQIEQSENDVHMIDESAPSDVPYGPAVNAETEVVVIEDDDKDENMIDVEKENVSPPGIDDRPPISPSSRRVLGEIAAPNIEGSIDSTKIAKPEADLIALGPIPELMDETKVIEIPEPVSPEPEIEPEPVMKKIAPALPPRNDRGMMFGSQQDVTECIENVMFHIEAALKPERIDDDGEQIDLVKDLFYGKTKQTLEVEGEPSAKSVRTKDERFSHLIVDVASGPRDIYDALDAYFDVETVNLDGKPARRYVTLSELPPILQIQVQRVQYDREQGRVFKSNAPLKFDSTIYLDRYMDKLESVDPIELRKRREQVWEWKRQLQELEARKKALGAVVDQKNKLSALEMLQVTAGWLAQAREASAGITGAVDVNVPVARPHESLLERQEGSGESREDVVANAMVTQLIGELSAEAASIAVDIPRLDGAIRELQARITSQYGDLTKLGYRVHSVFIHRGQATYGHYWIYIYDFATKKFRKYNDKQVSDVSEDEVMPFDSKFEFNGTFDESAATPYFLVFVKEDSTEMLIETVKRMIGVEDTHENMHIDA